MTAQQHTTCWRISNYPCDEHGPGAETSACLCSLRIKNGMASLSPLLPIGQRKSLMRLQQAQRWRKGTRSCVQHLSFKDLQTSSDAADHPLEQHEAIQSTYVTT